MSNNKSYPMDRIESIYRIIYESMNNVEEQYYNFPEKYQFSVEGVDLHYEVIALHNVKSNVMIQSSKKEQC